MLASDALPDDELDELEDEVEEDDALEPPEELADEEPALDELEHSGHAKQLTDPSGWRSYQVRPRSRVKSALRSRYSGSQKPLTSGSA